MASEQVADYGKKHKSEVVGILILNDLIQNTGGMTEPAPDM